MYVLPLFGKSKVHCVQWFTVPISPFTVLLSQCQSQGDGNDDDNEEEEEDAEDVECALVISQADGLVGHVDVLRLLLPEKFFVTFKSSMMKMN